MIAYSSISVSRRRTFCPKWTVRGWLILARVASALGRGFVSRRPATITVPLVQGGSEVIGRDILRASVQDSNAERGCARLVRQFTFRVVDRALRRVYGDDYSTL